MTAGIPKTYRTPEDFDAMVDLYVAECEANEEPLLFTGLALFLGFTTRQALYNYGSYPEFVDSFDRARLIISAGYEKLLSRPKCDGAKFALRCMDGWDEKRTVQHTSPDGSMSPKEPQATPALDAETIRAISKQLDDEC